MPKMTKPMNGGNGSQPTGEAAAPLQVRLVGQYIKDLSFENPNVDKLIEGHAETPGINIEINVDIEQMGPQVFESAITFKARAAAKEVVIYDLELVYAGAFEIQNAPPQALEPILLVNCPALTFPFLRRLVADITREGGFPPLLLDPVDFGALYMRKKELGMPNPFEPKLNA